jgi:mannose-6-phosphate isomerase-like protein (cupin superfamily)
MLDGETEKERVHEGLCREYRRGDACQRGFPSRPLYGKNLQLVLMTLQPGEEIGEEVHEDIDQFFRVEEGKAPSISTAMPSRIEDDFAAIVPAGARHNVVNSGSEPLKLYTLYGPPEHKHGTVHKDKAQAERDP